MLKIRKVKKYHYSYSCTRLCTTKKVKDKKLMAIKQKLHILKIKPLFVWILLKSVAQRLVNFNNN